MTGNSSRKWGFTAQEWSEARDVLLGMLADAATNRTTVTYGEVARGAFGGRVSARSTALMDLLGEVDSALDAERGIMIASLVVRADSGMPGEGFFRFAADELGHCVADRRAFWRVEVERVWDAYSGVLASRTAAPAASTPPGAVAGGPHRTPAQAVAP